MLVYDGKEDTVTLIARICMESAAQFPFADPKNIAPMVMARIQLERSAQQEHDDPYSRSLRAQEGGDA